MTTDDFELALRFLEDEDRKPVDRPTVRFRTWSKRTRPADGPCRG
jgi:hypothetical protein